RCCSESCQVVDSDGDGICDRDDECHLFVEAAPMDGVRRILIAYKKTGPGGEDDAFRNVGAVFRAGHAFDPTTDDDVHVTLETSSTEHGPGRPLLSATLAHTLWSRRN